MFMVGFSSSLVFGSTQLLFFMFSPLCPPQAPSGGPTREAAGAPCPVTQRAVVAPTPLERQSCERGEGELAPTGSNWFQPMTAAPSPLRET